MTEIATGAAVIALAYWLTRSRVRAWERRNGVPFFRIVKDTDPDAAHYLPELKGFSMVHQGGRYEVFCNGYAHKITNGGRTQIEARTRVIGYYKCECKNGAGQ